MKKSEILALSVALAGNLAMATQANAASTECGSVSTASDVATCAIAASGFTAEAINFSGSKGVKTNYDLGTNYFAACSSHVSGNKSFGMTTDSSAMVVRSATGKAAGQASGCVS